MDIFIRHFFIVLGNGFAFLYFKTDTSPCLPDPCMHGSSCFDVQGDFYCHCSENRKGKYCDEEKPQCSLDGCQGTKQLKNNTIFWDKRVSI